MTAFLALVVSLAATDSPAVANAGFENVDQQTGAPADWKFTSLPKQAHLVRYETKADPGGAASRALSITIAADHPEQKVSYNAHQDVPGIVAGKQYRVSAKVQAQGLRTLPMVVVQCLDQTGSQFLAFGRSQEKELRADVGEWESVQTEVTVPAGTSTFRLRIGVTAAGNAGGTALIDDIQVVEVQ
jgi:hypothetical protein